MFIQTTILISTVSSHAMFVYSYFLKIPANRLKAKNHPEMFATQSELNTSLIGKEFPLEIRVAAQLLLFYVPLVFSPGMPMLLYFGAFGLALGAAVDKVDLARHSKHPPPVDANVPFQMIRTMPMFLCMRLMFAAWVFSNPTIFPSNSDSAEYLSYVQNKVNNSENLSWLFARLGTNTAIPHVVLLAFIVAYMLIKSFVFPILEGSYHVIEKILESLNCHFLHSNLRPRAEGNSPFTEYYCERHDENFKQVTKNNKPKHYTPNIRRKIINNMEMTAPLVPPLSKIQKKVGWRVVNEDTFPEHTDKRDTEKPHYKVKTWMVNCTLRGHQRYANEIKLTWEVCQEAGVSSYKMHHNPKYAVIDELRREKLLLHSPMKDGADAVESSSSKYVYRGQEEQQNQDDVAKSYSVEQAGNVNAEYQQATPSTSYPTEEATSYPTEQAGYAEAEYQEDVQANAGGRTRMQKRNIPSPPKTLTWKNLTTMPI